MWTAVTPSGWPGKCTQQQELSGLEKRAEQEEVGDGQHQATHVPPRMHGQPAQGPEVAGQSLSPISMLVAGIPVL